MLVMEEMAETADTQPAAAAMEEMAAIVDLVMEETGEMAATVELVEGAGEMAVMDHSNGKKAFFKNPIFDFSYSHVDLVC